MPPGRYSSRFRIRLALRVDHRGDSFCASQVLHSQL
jgi:hypothetical protein